MPPMKKTRKPRLSLDQAASRLAGIMEKHLKRMPLGERKKRLKALDALAKKAARRIRGSRSRAGSATMSGASQRTLSYPLAAKAR